MSDLERLSGIWRKSTASGGGNCVEVSFAGAAVVMRNSRNPEGSVLRFTLSEWEAFLAGVRDGEFDPDQPRSHGERQRESVGK